MENIKKNPVLMGIFSAVGCAIGLLLVDFVVSKIDGISFQEQISKTYSLVLLIAGPIFSFFESFLKTKKKNENGGKEL